MTYNWYARKARNSTLPFGVRRSAFFSCILRLGWLNGASFLQTRERYNSRFGFDEDRADINKLMLALAAMEKDRNQMLEELRAFDKKRLREKMRGQRIPTKAQAALFQLGCKVRSS